MIEPIVGAPAPIGGRRQATVREVLHPSPQGVVLRLEVPDRVDHLPGQHYVIRLTAPDGYVAQRSYSVVSAPSDELLELFIERLDDGEVSTYLADVVAVGDDLEVRGPIGGWFVWDGGYRALGVAGGSGVAPFIAMQRHAAHIGRPDLLSLVVSARTRADLPYADELEAYGTVMVLTREDMPSGRPRGRMMAGDLQPLLRPPGPERYFVCGSASYAEAASMLLVAAGVPAADIRVERFGPSG